MHELSIAEAMVDQVVALAGREHAVGVARVTVQVGGLSGVDPEALRLAYPVVIEDTLAAGSVLEIEEIPARVRCRDCGAESVPDFPLVGCMQCGSGAVDIVAGRDLTLRSVELETPEQ